MKIIELKEEITEIGENFYQLALLADVQRIKTEYSSLAERFNKFAGAKYDGRLHIENEQILLRTYANMLAIRKAVTERKLYVLFENVTLPDGFLDYFKSQENCQWLIDEPAPTTEQPATIEDDKPQPETDITEGREFWDGKVFELADNILSIYKNDIKLGMKSKAAAFRLAAEKYYLLDKDGKPILTTAKKLESSFKVHGDPDILE
jgi:hypothetical protein